MAESKASINSKGGANVLAKRMQKQFNRAQEKVLQRLGKSEETKDEHFEQCVTNLHTQQSDGYRIYKDLKAYLNAVSVMRDASSRLFQSMYDAYDEKWDAAEDLGAVVEGEDLLWKDYEGKLHDQALITMESYMSQFPDIKEKVSKRNRKLVDYDSARHHLTSLQNAKKKDDIKIGKADDEMKAAKTIFEEMNRELKIELPILFDSRVGCYITVFQAVCNLRDIFYKEITKNNDNLQTVMKELSAQHPDKSFVVKNFNRSGSLKRRSFRDTLSPRSLKGFYDFHMSHNPRGSLRRDASSSFRSDRSAYGTYSPTSPQPLYENVSAEKESKSSPIPLDYTAEEGTPSHEPRVDETSASEDKPEEDKQAEKKESSNQEDKANEESEEEEDSNVSKEKTNSDPAESSKSTDQPSSVENGVHHDEDESQASSDAPEIGDGPSAEVKEGVKTEAPK